MHPKYHDNEKITLIWILVILWIAASIGAILIVNKYIEEKDYRLRREIRNNIEVLFENQSDGNANITFDFGLFDSPMNGGRVRNFKRAEIPPKPNKQAHEKSVLSGLIKYEDELDEWEESYGDLSSLWTLNWGSEDFREIEDGGWHIVGIRCHGGDNYFIHTFVLFPYQVGFKRTEWGNYYTVPDAVAEAFDFYTSNPKSGISDRYEKGSINRIWSKIYDCKNEYYGIYQNDKVHSWNSGKSIPGGGSPEKGGPIENGWVHNGYYRVYIAASQETHYGIIKHSWNPDIKERNRLLIWWLTGLFIIFWLPIIILIIKNKRSEKRNNETLKERLLRKCSPASLMQNYDKEKIRISNELYKEIIRTDDNKLLLELAEKAQQQLSITLIEEDELNSLRAICNPANYMKPYDAKKVEIANELYDKLNNSELSYLDFLEIKEKSRLL